MYVWVPWTFICNLAIELEQNVVCFLNSIIYIYTQSHLPGKNVVPLCKYCSSYLKHLPNLRPFLCTDNGGVVYSSKFLPFSGDLWN